MKMLLLAATAVGMICSSAIAQDSMSSSDMIVLVCKQGDPLICHQQDPNRVLSANPSAAGDPRLNPSFSPGNKIWRNGRLIRDRD